MNNCASLIGLTDQVLGELRAGHVFTCVEVKRHNDRICWPSKAFDADVINVTVHAGTGVEADLMTIFVITAAWKPVRA